MSAIAADTMWMTHRRLQAFVRQPGALLGRGGGLLALAAAMVWLSTRTFRAYQKSV